MGWQHGTGMAFACLQHTCAHMKRRRTFYLFYIIYSIPYYLLSILRHSSRRWALCGWERIDDLPYTFHLLPACIPLVLSTLRTFSLPPPPYHTTYKHMSMILPVPFFCLPCSLASCGSGRRKDKGEAVLLLLYSALLEGRKFPTCFCIIPF